MKLAILLAVLVPGALAPAAFVGAATPAAAQTSAKADWNTTYAVTEHGHLLGNPDAQIKLVSFASYTCPHCAHFEIESEGALRVGYINGGKVSLEARHLIRNPIDLAAALITECGSPERFFARHHAMLRAQERWLAEAAAMTPAQQQRWATGTLPERMRAIASDLDFYSVMEHFGLSRAQIDQCLSSEATARRLVSTSAEQSERYAIPGTPSFLINDELVEDVHDWQGLRAELDARG